ncbi:MAG: cellulose binding domain-containing protein [Deltaproteobacteria bacterium]
MVQRLGSKHEAVEHRAFWWWSAGGAALLFASAAACATGVDVSQAELAEICAESNVDCDGEPLGSGGTSPVGASGNSGSSGTSGNLGTSGSPSNTGGSSSGGNSGNTGTSGNSGTGGGSTGSAGAPAQPLQPLARGTCMATSSVVIVYTDRSNGAAASSNLTMTLHVNNSGPAFDLPDLTIRYWFTDDSLGDFTSDIDYAQQSNGMGNKEDVTVTFGRESGSNYAAIGFTAGGPVGPEGVDQVQVRLHTGDYKMANQSNDFSFLGSAAAVANANITPYVNGTQVGGCVPLPPEL